MRTSEFLTMLFGGIYTYIVFSLFLLLSGGSSSFYRDLERLMNGLYLVFFIVAYILWLSLRFDGFTDRFNTIMLLFAAINIFLWMIIADLKAYTETSYFYYSFFDMVGLDNYPPNIRFLFYIVFHIHISYKSLNPTAPETLR
ncbi:MAG: hypothetical protein ACTSYA_01275 [Candidatus Kariarchaeaceae archaeon]